MNKKHLIAVSVLAVVLLAFGGFFAKDLIAKSVGTSKSLSAVNNGSRFVQYGDAVYYREYNAESFETDRLAVQDESFPLPSREKQMKRITEDGKIETLFSDSGIGGFYIYKDRFYMQGYPGEGKYNVYSVNMQGTDRKELGKGIILGIDEKNGRLIINTSEQLSINALSTADGGIKELVPKNDDRLMSFITVKDGVVYYTDGTVRQDDAYSTQTIKCINTDGSGQKELFNLSPKNCTEELLEIALYIENIHSEIQGEYMYSIFGAYEGTGQFYTGGVLVRSKLDGSGAKVIAGNEGKLVEEDFYLMREGDKEYICYGYATEDADAKTETVRRSISASGVGPEEPWDKPLAAVHKGFFINGELYLYKDNSGTVSKVISKELFRSLGAKEKLPCYEEDKYVNVEKAELLGEYFYFTLERGKRAEENDVGWRYNYRREESKVCRYNLTDKRLEQLYSY